MSKALFIEEQKFNKKWVLMIVALPLIFSLWGIYKQIILGQAIGENPIPDWALILLLLVPLLLLGFFFCLSLHTRIDHRGIHYRFTPIHRKDRLVPWDSIKNAFVRKYKPIAEYGGWGFRRGRSGMALNTSGNIGLQIIFADGKKLLLGTQKETELKRVLEKLQKPLIEN